MEVSVKQNLENKIEEVINDCANRGILNSSVTIFKIYEIVKDVKDSELKNSNSNDEIKGIICEIINDYGKRDVLSSYVITRILDDVNKIFQDWLSSSYVFKILATGKISRRFFYLRKKFFVIRFYRGDFVDVNFELGDLKFVWDEEKAEKNRKKHGVKFSIAARVFLDDHKIDDFDELHSDVEDRFKIIGKVKEMLTVIYTERCDRNRIISARRADKNEEELYYGQFYF